jgi:hypothetical protein
MRRGWGILVSLLLVGGLLWQADCFGPNRYYAVMSHRANRVFIRHDDWYYVGKLPEGWENLRTGVKSASWYNPDYLSTISTEVFCEISVGDQPISVVASDVASALEQRTVTDSQKLWLDGRGALREKVSGSVDGVPVVMDIVAIKKDNCAFDMVAIMPPGEVPNVTPVFEDFFNGFRYGPLKGLEASEIADETPEGQSQQ